MRELHEKAAAEIEKQEKLKKRRMAITEASKSNPGAEDDEEQTSIPNQTADQENLPHTTVHETA